jgi:5-methylcytosine-specific restriction endonuclease McrA
MIEEFQSDRWWNQVQQYDLLRCVFCGRDLTQAIQTKSQQGTAMVAWWERRDYSATFASGVYCQGENACSWHWATKPGYLRDVHVEKCRGHLFEFERIVAAYSNWNGDALRRFTGVCMLLSRMSVVFDKRHAKVSAEKVEEERNKVTTALRQQVFERDGFRCRRCGLPSPVVTLVVDHVIPVSLGGLTELRNLQTLCWDCNAGKAARTPHPHDLRGR